jgi:transcription elongation factor GreA
MVTFTLIHTGSRVRFEDQDGEAIYTIVEPGESDIAAGRISDASPLGEALIGHGPGDRIDVRTPGGLRVVRIVDVN